MSSTAKQPQAEPISRKTVAARINQVLTGIRVPDLPYPAGNASSEALPDWRPLLLSCWSEQRDERVTHVLRSVQIAWSIRQVNAAYLADRIMDVFLNTSGLHASLVKRIARLRFWFAWRLGEAGGEGFPVVVLDWLNHLQEWRGWSDTGGRSSRVLLDLLDSLVIAVAASFEQQSIEPVEDYCQQWLNDSLKQRGKADKLRRRLYETERGLSRQRHAEYISKALVGRALKGRQLPAVISSFVLNDWLLVLKQSVLSSGEESELCRHANKILEWLVWASDPALSDRDRSKLYRVGEQIGDLLHDVWRRAMEQDIPVAKIEAINAVIVDRIKGETIDLEAALPANDSFSYDIERLDRKAVAASDVEPYLEHWFVQGEGVDEQRRFFFTLLPDSQEIVWTNGSGVKLGLQDWTEFQRELKAGTLRLLPDLKPFGEVLAETIQLLVTVCDKQQQQREQAARDVRARAEAIRREKEQAERLAAEQKAAHEAELEQQRAEAEQQRIADEKLKRDRLAREAEAEASRKVDQLGLEGWIVIEPEGESGAPLRLKLAVKIAATGKFVFVDRLGLNRHQFMRGELVAGIVAGTIKILGGGAAFDDTLSRVVGRIRGGRNEGGL
ncbi:DUF1631 family protein [Marinobacter sp. S0848L]|uniref:DUF1631 family protein n=1 Tax=Marinobacter sp. S0848L TaxID=2926423 RepID=UPI001FF3A20A|nr:DUF1631 family protein [Marinobacter sp. S0848L]MCK0105570.1 DUF1631 domain-containing protein [Marinobacter sp. S0848L]